MIKYLSFLVLVLFNSDFAYSQTSEEYLQLAYSYHQKKEYYQAIKNYTKAIELNNQNYQAFFNRALCYSRVDNYNKSIYDFKRVLEIDSTIYETYLALAYTYAEKKDHLKSAESFRNAQVREVKMDYSDYYSYGTSYYFAGMNDSAKKYLEISYDMDKQNSLAPENLAWVYLKEDSKRSCKMFKENYLRDTTDARRINNLGYAYLLDGDLDSAFYFIKKAEIKDPKNSFVYRNYSLYYKQIGNKELACLNLQKAIDLDIVVNYGRSYIRELELYCSN